MSSVYYFDVRGLQNKERDLLFITIAARLRLKEAFKQASVDEAKAKQRTGPSKWQVAEMQRLLQRQFEEINQLKAALLESKANHAPPLDERVRVNSIPPKPLRSSCPLGCARVYR